MWAEHVARIGERSGTHRALVGKTQEIKPIGRRGSEDNNEMDLQEVECGVMDWIDLAEDRDYLADTCEQGNEP